MPDWITEVLDKTTLSKEQKADAWDMVSGASDDATLTRVLDALPVPRPFRAELWDARKKTETSKPEPYVPQSVLMQGRRSASLFGGGNREDAAQGLGVRLSESPVFQSPAHPSEAGDLLAVAGPFGSSVPALTSAFPVAAPRAGETLGKPLTTLGNFLTETNIAGVPAGKPFGAVATRVGEKLRGPYQFAQDKRLLGMTGETPTPRGSTPVPLERDLYSTWKEPSAVPVTGPLPRLVPGGAPTVEGSIQQELQNLMGSRAAPARATAPVPSGGTMTPGGMPSVSAAEQAAIEQATAAARQAAPVAPVASHAPATAQAAAPAVELSTELQKSLDKAMSRAKVTLTTEQQQAAAQLIREGHPPVSAVQRIATMSDVQKLAAEIGSRNAGRKLGIAGGAAAQEAAVDTLRGHAMAALPSGARAAIDAAIPNLKSEAAIQAYINAAPNPVAKTYVLYKLGRLPE